MFISFKNLCASSIDNFVEGGMVREDRKSCHAADEYKDVQLYPAELGDKNGWVVSLCGHKSLDPKIHFLDEAKAIKFYDMIANNIHREGFLQIDVLEHGAI